MLKRSKAGARGFTLIELHCCHRNHCDSHRPAAASRAGSARGCPADSVQKQSETTGTGSAQLSGNVLCLSAGRNCG